MDVYDNTGRAILIGDVLKVFHFNGARRKKHFMYKQVVGETTLGEPEEGETPMRYLEVSHLNMVSFLESHGGYWLAKDGTKLDRYEIVQGSGIEPCEQRAKTWVGVMGRLLCFVGRHRWGAETTLIGFVTSYYALINTCVRGGCTATRDA